MRINKGWGMLPVVISLAMLVAGGGTAAAAGSQQEAAPVLVDVSVLPAEDSQVVVSLWFNGAQGQALEGQEVSFFLEIDFLGQSLVSLGSAMTDDDGLAQIHYPPTWEGTQHIVARLPGGEEYKATETAIEFDVAGIGEVHEFEPPVMGGIRVWTPIAVGVVVLLVWATMGLVVVLTVKDIVIAGRRRDLTALRYPVGVAVAASRSSGRQSREQIVRQPRY